MDACRRNEKNDIFLENATFRPIEMKKQLKEDKKVAYMIDFV